MVKGAPLTIASEDGIFFLENKTHMIHRVTWCVEGSQRSTLNFEYLAVVDVCFAIANLLRHVFVYRGLRTDLEQIGDALDVVMVPMGQQRLVHRGLLLLQDGLEQAWPTRHSFAGVNQQALRATADQVCVCSYPYLSAC
jgi:hypothetical protein